MVDAEIVALALSAATVVARQALGAFGKDAGKAAAEAAGDMVTRLRTWLSERDDDEAVNAVAVVEANPERESGVHLLTEVLQERLAADPRFAEELAGMVALVAQQDARVQHATSVTMTAQDQAQVGRMIGNIEGDYTERRDSDR